MSREYHSERAVACSAGPEQIEVMTMLENFFKSEVRTSGSKLVAQEKISVPSGTDTDIHAYVRVAPPFRVVLSSKGIGSESFTADCSCPASKKGQFCKHI